jgi:hypothetical protein
MSAIADFSVAVLDCPSCCRHFIENFVAMAKHDHRVACPHCGADYVEPADEDAFGGDALPAVSPGRHAYGRRGLLHLLGQRRRKLQ